MSREPEDASNPFVGQVESPKEGTQNTAAERPSNEKTKEE